ncbi:MAG: L-threonylcarbamoyladenylate synthase [Maribacter sp.]
MTEEINKSIEALEKGGLILYPTDTVWGIGCDATNEAAVNKIYDLKNRDKNKALICLVGNDAMLEKYIETVSDLAYDIMDLSTKPTTIIYDNPKGIAQNLIVADKTLAVRVASDKFCQYLINKFKKPIVSTSANIEGSATPKSFKEIDRAILTGVDYVVNLHRETTVSNSSSIIRLGNDGTVIVIRE